ncbi:unnamed protein product [Amoebophrya sp. A120]|nr:unnamed protein product [Amoebophrya sp. A120]|eukprot:GSA120T00017755001.1
MARFLPIHSTEEVARKDQQGLNARVQRALERAQSGDERALSLVGFGLSEFPAVLIQKGSEYDYDNAHNTSDINSASMTTPAGGGSSQCATKPVDLRWDNEDSQNNRPASSSTSASEKSEENYRLSTTPSTGRNSTVSSTTSSKGKGKNFSRLKPNPAFFNEKKQQTKDVKWWEEEEIRQMDLSQNKLQFIPHLLSASPLFHNLEKLSLQENQFFGLPCQHKLDVAISGLENLKTLDVRENTIESLEDLPLNIVELLCSWNKQLQKIEPVKDTTKAVSTPGGGQDNGVKNTTPCSQLAILQAAENNLPCPNFLRFFPNLVRVNLKANALTGPFGPFDCLRNVVELEVDKNRLTGLDLTLMDKLRTLTASQNQISIVQSGTAMLNLDTLNLAYNRLHGDMEDRIFLNSGGGGHGQHVVFDQELQNESKNNTASPFPKQTPSNLTVLILSNNQLRSLPEHMALNFPHLQTLDIQNNDLTCLPTSLGFSPELKRIVTDGNAIKAIRPQVLRGGVEDLKKYLRDRHNNSHVNNNIGPSSSSCSFSDNSVNIPTGVDGFVDLSPFQQELQPGNNGSFQSSGGGPQFDLPDTSSSRQQQYLPAGRSSSGMNTTSIGGCTGNNIIQNKNRTSITSVTSPAAAEVGSSFRNVETPVLLGALAGVLAANNGHHQTTDNMPRSSRMSHNSGRGGFESSPDHSGVGRLSTVQSVQQQVCPGGQAFGGGNNDNNPYYSTTSPPYSGNGIFPTGTNARMQNNHNIIPPPRGPFPPSGGGHHNNEQIPQQNFAGSLPPCPRNSNMNMGNIRIGVGSSSTAAPTYPGASVAAGGRVPGNNNMINAYYDNNSTGAPTTTRDPASIIQVRGVFKNKVISTIDMLARELEHNLCDGYAPETTCPQALHFENCGGYALEDAGSICAFLSSSPLPGFDFSHLRQLAFVRCNWGTQIHLFLPFLQSLDLSRNRFTLLPDVSTCLNLHELRLSQNRFSRLCGQEAVQKLPLGGKLTVLDLSDNQIQEITNGEVFAVTKLNTLLLQNNSLRDLPLSWGCWVALRALTLEGNMTRRHCEVLARRGVDGFKKYQRERSGMID